MSSGRIHARNLACNWFAHGANLVVMFLLSPFVVHTLGRVEYAIWRLLTVLTGYMGILDLGVGVCVPPRWGVPLLRRIMHLDNLVRVNVASKFGVRKGLNDLLKLRWSELLFQWANSELKSIYQKGLAEAGQLR